MKHWKIEKRKVNDLKFYPGNPRKISKEMLEKLKNSIREFGAVEPLVINKQNEVIGGNQRLKALQELGIEEVDCIVVDLPKSKEKALNIALNKIQGEFDEDLLRLFVNDIELPDFDLTGLEDIFKEQPEDYDKDFVEVEPKPYKKFHILLSFDIDAYVRQIDKINKFISSLEGVEVEKSQN
jgi:hypothetical protein